MDNALRLFEELRDNGLEKIKSFISDRQEENLFIDFKSKSNPDIAGANNDDKKVYAKALSAFSNSAGGIIVWGIDSRAGEGKLDVATELKPIKDLKKFLTDLVRLTSEAIVPLNTGIQNTPILLDGENDSGFIVTYVPESGLPPHRAMFKDNKYYTRAGGSSILMEHHMLEDSFGRRQKPKLEINYWFQGRSIEQFQIVFGIKNIGKYIARYPAIKVTHDGNSKFHEYSGGIYTCNLKPIRSDSFIKGALFAGGSNDIIHPNTHLDVAYLEPKHEWTTRNGLINLSNNNKKLKFSYELFAIDCLEMKGEVNISPEDILDHFRI